MNDSFDDGVFEKARRNLMAISGAVAIFGFLSPGISKISILGTEISVGSDHSRIWAALSVISLYMFVRFFQVVDSNDIVSNEAVVRLKKSLVVKFSMLLESSKINKRIYDNLIMGRVDATVADVRYSYRTDFCYNFPEHALGLGVAKTRLVEHYERTLEFHANISFSATVTEAGVAGISSSKISDYAVKPRKIVLFFCSVCAYFVCLIFNRWSSDFLMPLIFGLLAVIYTINNAASVISYMLT